MTNPYTALLRARLARLVAEREKLQREPLCGMTVLNGCVWSTVRAHRLLTRAIDATVAELTREVGV